MAQIFLFIRFFCLPEAVMQSERGRAIWVWNPNIKQHLIDRPIPLQNRYQPNQQKEIPQRTTSELRPQLRKCQTQTGYPTNSHQQEGQSKPEHTYGCDNVNAVYTKIMADYHAVLRNLQSNQKSYHTYSSGKRSHHAFMLRSLQEDQTPNTQHQGPTN